MIYANSDLAAYDALTANYESDHALWEEQKTQSQQAYEDAHEAWVEAGSDPETEPQPPPVAPEPQPPAPPTTTYEYRELENAEPVETEYGPALIVPPSGVVSSSAGVSFGMVRADFDRSYTERDL